MLSDGISFDDVLDKVQASAGRQLSYLHFITKTNLKNITNEFGINRDIVLHANDADSVAAWVQLTKNDTTTANLVRYVKFQNEEDTTYGLSKDEFVLIIMSDAQVTATKKFAGPMKEIALDSTHGTNCYNFQLTTFLVVDDYSEGFPCAFMYSSRVDEQVTSIFLSIVKDIVGIEYMTDVILMTDDTNVYSNAWQSTIGQPAHRLLCSWHVDNAWRKNLAKIKGNLVLKATVYKTLRAMMEIADKDIFHIKLDQFLACALTDPKTQLFDEYFSPKKIF